MLQTKTHTHTHPFQIEFDQPVCLDCSHMENISCQLDTDGAGVHCQDDNCPYKEEKHPISLTVYIHSYSRLEAYTKSFYLREIGASFLSNVLVCFAQNANVEFFLVYFN